MSKRFKAFEIPLEKREMSLVCGAHKQLSEKYLRRAEKTNVADGAYRRF